jgi:hypothetical protein
MGVYVEALAEYTGTGRSLFLAGGITACGDWQRDISHALADLPFDVLNPRRANFPMDDPNAAEEQIRWEHRYIRRATAVLFWFPSETLCPITLYELGTCTMMGKPLFVGTHPAYARRSDVIIQTRLARPEIVVVDSLDALLDQARSWAPPLTA